jgi:hypothetical protein
MSIAIGEETSIESVLTSVKEELDLKNTTNEDFYLRRLIKETERNIFSLDQTIQSSEILDIENNMAKLPCDFVMFNITGGIRFIGVDNMPVGFWIYPTNIRRPFFTNNSGYGWSTVQQNKQCLYFDGYYNGVDNSLPSNKVEVGGLFLRKNDLGGMYIPMLHERALIDTTCYKFIRSRINNKQFGFLLAQMEDYKRASSWGIKAATAKSKMPDANQKQILAQVWNQLLPNGTR